MIYIRHYIYHKVHITGSNHYEFSPVNLFDPVQLNAEEDNPYDSEAVSVWHDGDLIGYMHSDSQLKPMYHDYIRKGGVVRASIDDIQEHGDSEQYYMELEYFLPGQDEDSKDLPLLFESAGDSYYGILEENETEYVPCAVEIPDAQPEPPAAISAKPKKKKIQWFNLFWAAAGIAAISNSLTNISGGKAFGGTLELVAGIALLFYGAYHFLKPLIK